MPRRLLGGFAALAAGLSFVLAGALSHAHKREDLRPAPVLMHGAPGVKFTSKGNEVRWRKRNTTVYLDSSIERLGPGAREAVVSAFGTWLESDAKLPGLRFDTIDGVSAEAKADGKNSVVFAPITLPGHERDLAITVTYSDEKTGDILESDIVINSNFPFELLDATHSHFSKHGSGDEEVTPSREDRRSSCVAHEAQASCGRVAYDFANVVTHEVGHFFGLGEDMEDTSSTMYLCTNRCETHKRQLATADVTVLTGLYAGEFGEPEPSNRAASCAVTPAISAGGPLVPVFGGFWLALVLAVRRRR